MNTRILLIIACLLGGMSLELSAQEGEILRGKVTYEDGVPVQGATIRVQEMSLGGISNVAGDYEIKGLPAGPRLVIICSDYQGRSYIKTTNLSRGRVGVLNFQIDYPSTTLDTNNSIFTPPSTLDLIDELTGSPDPKDGHGTFVFQPERTEQSIAGANDQSREVMRLPGVKSWADNLADIVIRGNSPMGLMWRLEGIDIPNPNHFARKGNTGGGITMFSAQVMGEGKFHRGSMAPEYGNSFAGAFDVNFRNGNPINHEYRARIGAIGLDFSAEGPIRKKDTTSSFLINYRYSFLGLLSTFGVEVNAPFTSNNFQDLSFSLNLPSKDQMAKVKIFGVGGLSREFWDVDPEAIYINANGREERIFDTNTGIIGFSYDRILSPSSRLKITLAAMGNQVIDRDEQIDSTSLVAAGFMPGQLGGLVPSDFNGLPRDAVENEVYSTGRYSTHILYKKYFGQGAFKTTIQAGLQASHITFNFEHQDILPFESNFTTLVEGRGSSQLIQPYVQVVKPFYKKEGIREVETWTIVGGFHAMYLTLNGSAVVDPRLMVTYKYGDNGTVGLSYGIHSRIVPLGSYFTEDVNGTLVNQNLDMIRSNQVTASIRQVTNLGTLTIEGYYQSLINVPVTVNPSAYWLLNDRDGYATEALTSDGTGTNMGIDVGLMRPLFNNLFWTVSGSIYRSTATTSDGITRASSYVGRENFGYYTANTLGGEFKVRESKKEDGNDVFLQLGVNLTLGTGTRFIPADEVASLEAGELILDHSGIHSSRTGNYHRIDTRVAVRFGSWLISLDLQNATNNTEEIRGTWMRFGVVEDRPQTELTPLFSIRADF